jgi:hypothetical protein
MLLLHTAPGMPMFTLRSGYPSARLPHKRVLRRYAVAPTAQSTREWHA